MKKYCHIQKSCGSCRWQCSCRGIISDKGYKRVAYLTCCCSTLTTMTPEKMMALVDVFLLVPGNNSEDSIIWRGLEESQKAILRDRACRLTELESPGPAQWILRYQLNLQTLLKNLKNISFDLTLMKHALLKSRANRLHLRIEEGIGDCRMGERYAGHRHRIKRFRK